MGSLRRERSALADRLSLAGWSIHRRFQRDENPLALTQFPAVAREEFGFDAVELNNLFFASTDDTYLRELAGAARRARVTFTGIAVDGTGDPSALDERRRREAVRSALPWFEISKKLGIPMLRINTGGNGAEKDPRAIDQCIRSMKELVKAAEETGVKLLIENHGGLSVNPLNMVRIVQEVDHPMFGVLPDFGNFPDPERPRFLSWLQEEAGGIPPEEVRYWGLKQLAPYALAVHVKVYSFNDAGEDQRIDVFRGVRILREAGYSGYWALEYGGGGDDHEGVLKGKRLLERALWKEADSETSCSKRSLP